MEPADAFFLDCTPPVLRSAEHLDDRQQPKPLHKVKGFVRRYFGGKGKENALQVAPSKPRVRRTSSNVNIAPSIPSNPSSPSPASFCWDVWPHDCSPSTLPSSLGDDDDAKHPCAASPPHRSPASSRRSRRPDLPISLRGARSSPALRPPPLVPSTLPFLPRTDILDYFPSPPGSPISLSTLYISTGEGREERGWADEVLEEADECADRAAWLEERRKSREAKEEEVHEKRGASQESFRAMMLSAYFPSRPGSPTSLSAGVREEERGWADEVLQEVDKCVDWAAWLEEWTRIREAGAGATMEERHEKRMARRETLRKMIRSGFFPSPPDLPKPPSTPSAPDSSTTGARAERSWAEEVLQMADECVDWDAWMLERRKSRVAGKTKGAKEDDAQKRRTARRETLRAMMRSGHFPSPPDLPKPPLTPAAPGTSKTGGQAARGRAEEVLQEADEPVDWAAWLEEQWQTREAG